MRLGDDLLVSVHRDRYCRKAPCHLNIKIPMSRMFLVEMTLQCICFPVRDFGPIFLSKLQSKPIRQRLHMDVTYRFWYM
jgi:hypothetical protein